MAAALLALTACGKSKPTAGTEPAPPGGLGGAPTPGGDGMPGMGGPPGRPGRMPPRPTDPGVGQPGDATLPTPPQSPNLTSNALSRQQSQNNLKQIGIAMHNAADTYRTFPVGIADKSGKVGLSWRVAILPFIEQENLYKQFKLDEPWDSEHNKKLIPLMPKTFAPPGVDTNGYTWYRSFSGPDTVMPPSAQPGKPGQVVLGGVGLANITDGTSNTLLVAEAAEPVIWTRPDEVAFDKTKPPPKLGGSVFKDGSNVVMCDGSTRFIKSTINPTQLSNAINRQDGMPVNLDD
jgi:hypothetical protein